MPEKFFLQDYSNNIGNEYIENNLMLLDDVSTPFYFCGDLNTVSIQKMFKEFFDRRQLLNAFENIPTRPLKTGNAVVQDVICYPNSLTLQNRRVEKSETDHYLIWAEIS